MAGTTGTIDTGNAIVDVASGAVAVTTVAPTSITSATYTTMLANLAADPLAYADRSLYQISDGADKGIVYVVNHGDLVKDAQYTNGAALVTDPAYSMIKYTGSGYTYLCEAAIGTARSTAAWRVARVTDATGDMVFAGTGLFEHAATSLAVVAALTYTLGA